MLNAPQNGLMIGPVQFGLQVQPDPNARSRPPPRRCSAGTPARHYPDQPTAASPRKAVRIRVKRRRGRSDGIIPVPWRLRIGVAVEHRLDSRCARPESATAHFVRICVAGHAIRQPWHAGMLRRGAARKARAGQVEGSPKQVDRADLAREPGAKHVENPRGLQQDAPEALRKLGVVGAVHRVLFEGNRGRNFIREMPDAHRRTQALQRAHHLLVKRRHGHRFKRNRSGFALAGFHQQAMFKKIEIDLQHTGAVRHGRGGHAANRGVEGHVPAVIDGRCKCQPDLAHNLHP